jgi:hypothetical protein
MKINKICVVLLLSMGMWAPPVFAIEYTPFIDSELSTGLLNTVSDKAHTNKALYVLAVGAGVRVQFSKKISVTPRFYYGVDLLDWNPLGSKDFEYEGNSGAQLTLDYQINKKIAINAGVIHAVHKFYAEDRHRHKGVTGATIGFTLTPFSTGFFLAMNYRWVEIENLYTSGSDVFGVDNFGALRIGFLL